jgi:hypothetical protein
MLRSLWDRLRLWHVLIVLIGTVPGSAWCDTAATPVPDSVVERLQAVWNAPKLYHDPDNPVIQSFALVGRYHGQYWSVDADQGKDDDWENRRIYLGFKAALFRDLLVEVQMNVNDDFAPVYDELYVAFVNWRPEGADFSASLGRLDYLFTGMERSVSSKRIATFERALLVNQLMPGEVVGLHFETTDDALSFHTGLYSGSIEQEFSNFDGGFAADFGLAYRLPLFYEKGTLHADFLFQDGGSDNDAFEPYKRIVSIWHKGQAGAFGLGLDVTAGGGGQDGRASVYGLTLLPTYDVLRNLVLRGGKLQLALRYQFAESDGDNGLQLPGRYERQVVIGDGDSFHALYAGLNYFLYGDRLKLMAAIEYSLMDDSANDGGDYQGWTYLAGLRLYF